MSDFRFAIMGAGRIANKFCEAVALTQGCCVAAVASKSQERAETFARDHGIPAAYGDYEQMLLEEKPDCVYRHHHGCAFPADHAVPQASYPRPV